MSDASSSVASRRSESALGIAWTVVIAVTALGHLTAVRNTLLVVVSLSTLVAYRRHWRALPAKAPVLALVAWAGASLLWSAAPAVSFAKLRTDLWIPLVAGAAMFCFARDGRGLRAMTSGAIAGLAALSALSLFAYLPTGWAPAGWPLVQAPGIVQPLLVWYPGPGDASMFAIVSIAPLMLAWRLGRNGPGTATSRWTIVVGAVLLVFVLVTTNNRNAVLVAPFAVLLQWWLDRRAGPPAGDGRSRRSLLRRAAIAAGSAIALVVLAGLLEFGARERLAYLKRPVTGDSAAVELVATDTRPTIWRYYGQRGLEHPWIGMGFGRTVPGIGWHTESDRALAAVEPNAYIHAHNVALDWWLQLGLVGLALLATAIGSLYATARRMVAAAGGTTAARAVDHALIALVVAVAARNMTDDFLVYGMAAIAAIVVGGLAGDLSRRARAADRTVGA